MLAKEAIIKIMNRHGYRQAAVAREIGVSRSAINKCLKDNCMSMDTFIGICQAMGYDVIVRKGEEEFEIEMGQRGIERLP